MEYHKEKHKPSSAYSPASVLSSCRHSLQNETYIASKNAGLEIFRTQKVAYCRPISEIIATFIEVCAPTDESSTS